MSISSFIREKKQGFRNYQHSQTLQREAALKQEAIERRQKAGELAQAQAARVRAERDARNIEAFTKKNTAPSGIQRFGQGLAKVMNKTKADVKDAKSKGYMRGIDFGGSKPSNARRAGNTLSRINQGSTGLAFGGSSQGNNNPFSSGQRDLEYGRPAPVVRQPARPKTKTIIRY